MAKPPPETVAAYITRRPPAVRRQQNDIRHALAKAFPAAQFTLSYNLPTLVLGRPLIWFAAFKHHISVFPPVPADAKLLRALRPYLNEKATLQFPLGTKIPLHLIVRLAKHRAKLLATRSGPSPAHRRLALQAATTAAKVLRHFEKERPKDLRPRNAIAALRAWAKGKLPFKEVRTAALAAHAAARAAKSKPAIAAARSAAHAAATAHVPTHAQAAYSYALKATL